MAESAVTKNWGQIPRARKSLRTGHRRTPSSGRGSARGARSRTSTLHHGPLCSPSSSGRSGRRLPPSSTWPAPTSPMNSSSRSLHCRVSSARRAASSTRTCRASSAAAIRPSSRQPCCSSRSSASAAPCRTRRRLTTRSSCSSPSSASPAQTSPPRWPTSASSSRRRIKALRSASTPASAISASR